MPSKKIWYVGDFNAHTNEVIAESQLMHVWHKKMLCIDGVKRDLWEVDEEFVKTLRKNRAESQLDFKVFCRESKGSPVRRRTLEDRKLTLVAARKKGLIGYVRA